MLRFPVVVDDAFISLRAARNWVTTGWPEYNPGVREWVPTPFAWVALLALVHAVTHLPLPPVAQVLGAAAGLLTVILPVLLLPTSRRVAFFAAVGCAASSAWAAWPLSGMESSFFALLVSASMLFVMRYMDSLRRRDAVISGLLCGLAVATRLDGVWFVPAGLLAVASARRPKDLGWFALAFLAAALPAMLFLQIVFGTVLPNSYYAKVHGFANLASGRAHVLGFARMMRLEVWFPVLLLPLLVPALRRKLLVLCVAVGAWTGWVMVEGGDFMAYHRFLHPIWTLVTLAFALGLVAAEDRLAAWRPALRPTWRWLVLLVAALAAGSWAVPSFRGAELRRYKDFAVEERTRTAIGRWFAGRYPASEWMAVKPAGIIPYYSGMRAVDFFCLVDGKAARTGEWVEGGWIGHQRMNAARIHEIGPKIVILEPRLFPLDELPPPGATDPNHGKTWIVHPDAARYRAVRAEILPGQYLNYFERL